MARPATFLKQNWGLEKKNQKKTQKKTFKKIQQKPKLVPIKNKWVKHRRFICSKIPQHCRVPAVPTQTGTRGCSLRGHSFALLWWQLEGACQLLPPASTSLPQQAPAAPCASQINTMAVTQQKELVPDNPNPSLSIYSSPVPSILLPCPKRLKKKKKNQEVVTFQIHSGI